jgi:hypothetical protein
LRDNPQLRRLTDAIARRGEPEGGA